MHLRIQVSMYLIWSLVRPKVFQKGVIPRLSTSFQSGRAMISRTSTYSPFQFDLSGPYATRALRRDPILCFFFLEVKTYGGKRTVHVSMPFHQSVASEGLGASNKVHMHMRRRRTDMQLSPKSTMKKKTSAYMRD